MSRNQPADGNKRRNIKRMNASLADVGPGAKLSPRLAITIDYATLRSLMLDYINERNETEEIALHGDDGNTLSLERQLTLSGFLVWLKDKQKIVNSGTS